MFDFMKNNDGNIAIELGKKYRDTVHGIEGIATCHSRYLTGCDRVGLEYMKDGEIKDFWVDVNRLEGVKIPPDQQLPGGPQKHAPSKSTG